MNDKEAVAILERIALCTLALPFPWRPEDKTDHEELKQLRKDILAYFNDKLAPAKPSVLKQLEGFMLAVGPALGMYSYVSNGKGEIECVLTCHMCHRHWKQKVHISNTFERALAEIIRSRTDHVCHEPRPPYWK